MAHFGIFKVDNENINDNDSDDLLVISSNNYKENKFVIGLRMKK